MLGLDVGCEDGCLDGKLTGCLDGCDVGETAKKSFLPPEKLNSLCFSSMHCPKLNKIARSIRNINISLTTIENFRVMVFGTTLFLQIIDRRISLRAGLAYIGKEGSVGYVEDF